MGALANIPDVFRDYEYVSDLSPDGKVQMVKSATDMDLFVLKQLTFYNMHVYRFLKENKSVYYPEIFELYEENHVLYVLEEYIAGDSLGEIIEQRGYFNSNQVRQFAADLCTALMPLHRQTPPIVHRDLKPENILYTPEGILKIIDFDDTARQYEDGNEKDTVVMGTRMFAAPEQFGYSQTDPRSDIYAIGVMMNYLLCGKYPKDHLAEGSLENLIAKATRFDPDNRYQSLSELQTALRTYAPSNHKEASARAKNKRKMPKSAICRFLPPGFRTGKPGNVTLSLLVYFFVIYTSFTLSVSGTDDMPLRGADLFLNRFTFLLICVLLILFWFNYLGVHRFLPLMKRRRWKIVGYILYTFAIIFIPLILLIILETIFWM